MVDLPRFLQVPSRATKARAFVASQMNFYRVHLIAFTIIPLVCSAILWGVNTEYKIAYIDCLFICMSAMTVTGLATVNLSQLSPLQQVILFVQMVIGSLTFVSIIMIIVRIHFFRSTFRHVIDERRRKAGRRPSINLHNTLSRVATAGQAPLSSLRQRFNTKFGKGEKDEMELNGHGQRTPTPSSGPDKPFGSPGIPQPAITHPNSPPKKEKKKKGQITKDMIKRVGGGGVGLVNPMGWYDQDHSDSAPSRLDTPNDTPTATTPAREETSPVISPGSVRSPTSITIEDKPREEMPALMLPSPKEDEAPLRFQLNGRDSSTLDENAFVEDRTDSPPPMDDTPAKKTPYAGRAVSDEAFPRSKTIAFDDPEDGVDHDHHDRRSSVHDAGLARTGTLPRSGTTGRGDRIPRTATMNASDAFFPQTYSLRPTTTYNQPRRKDTKLSGFGGFPTPFEIIRWGAKRVAPGPTKTLTKSFTMPRTNTYTGRASFGDNPDGGKEVPYISFSASVGRNSRFRDLTEDQMAELGGVEYRALRVLKWIVICYFVFVQLFTFIIIGPYIAAGGRYDWVWHGQYRYVSPYWFALFNAVSAYSNTGMSLVDTSMVPFQHAYLMIALIIVLIFAGNTAFPVFLRLTVWCCYKVVPKASHVGECLKFLLDHPRRCFVYMFPSTQSWVLALVMLSLTLTDWVCFLVLDIGTPAIEALPVGTRIAAAFLQSAAVRAAGFGIVPLAALAPAVKVLYVVMMYISVYPIALSVRSTNVYEERSLGVFTEDDEDYETDEKGAQAVAKYLGWHARRQLAFDIWWLAFALWLVCIIERGQINNEANATWFTIFNIIFELVSAYGTVGLSLGVPYDNYSFSGSFRTLSKLVVIAVMLRGRHRGLPVAIDRAVMLPKDFSAEEETAFDEERSRRASRRGSTSQGVMDEVFSGISALHGGGVPNTRTRQSVSTAGRRSSPGEELGQHLGSTISHQRSASMSVPESPRTLAFAPPSRSSLDRERQRSPNTALHRLPTLNETGLSRGPTRQDSRGE